VLRVLIADDDRKTRQTLREMVERLFSAQVIAEASNGLEAVRAAEHTHPDLVLMDISMPVLSGVYAAQQLQTLYRNLRIIMVTSHTMNIYALESFRSGAQGYVVKACLDTELPEAIRAVLAGQHFCSTRVE
jgi:two-component system, NarL family, nitrate/nitrite response regulator NarL